MPGRGTDAMTPYRTPSNRALWLRDRVLWSLPVIALAVIGGMLLTC